MRGVTPRYGRHIAVGRGDHQLTTVLDAKGAAGVRPAHRHRVRVVARRVLANTVLPFDATTPQRSDSDRFPRPRMPMLSCELPGNRLDNGTPRHDRAPLHPQVER